MPEVESKFFKVGEIWVPGSLSFEPHTEFGPGINGIRDIGSVLYQELRNAKIREDAIKDGHLKVLRLQGEPGEQFPVSREELLTYGNPDLPWSRLKMLLLPPDQTGWPSRALMGLSGQMGLWMHMGDAVRNVRVKYRWPDGHSLGGVPRGDEPFPWNVGTFFVVE